MFCGQGQLKRVLCGFMSEIFGLLATKRAAACASSSIAILAATVEIEAGRDGLAAKVEIEQMRYVWINWKYTTGPRPQSA